MSRRRKPKTPVTSSAAPNDGTPLGHMSDAELLREVARRRLAKGDFDLAAIEDLAENAQRDMGEETLAAAIAALPPEDRKPKPCPRCGYLVPVKARNRLRHILTVAGELRFTRNYHHCKCGTGFYPRDAELRLPEEGEVSDAMERRILDFRVNDTFESVAERWSIHYPTTISANLVRRVIERVGVRCEAASDERLQQACRGMPEQPASMLVVATDGSMLLTREAGPSSQPRAQRAPPHQALLRPRSNQHFQPQPRLAALPSPQLKRARWGDLAAAAGVDESFAGAGKGCVGRGRVLHTKHLFCRVAFVVLIDMKSARERSRGRRWRRQLTADSRAKVGWRRAGEGVRDRTVRR